MNSVRCNVALGRGSLPKNLNKNSKINSLPIKNSFNEENFLQLTMINRTYI